MAVPLLIAGAALGAAGGIGKGIMGGKQISKAKDALQNLEGQEPDIYVPSAVRQRASEPISELLLESQEESQARRTGQAVSTLQKAGARGILGGLNSVLDAERGAERERTALLEQERKRALGQLGAAEERAQDKRMQNYLSKVAAAQRSLEAGQQNVAGALDFVGGVGQQMVGAELMGVTD